jgi:hypothetical protein
VNVFFQNNDLLNLLSPVDTMYFYCTEKFDAGA